MRPLRVGETHFRETLCKGALITDLPTISSRDANAPPRAIGSVRLGTKRAGDRTVLDRFRQSGSLKCLFPRARGRGLDTVLLNTAGGVTGGDTLRTAVHVASGCDLTVTTQACERVYKARPGPVGRVRNRLTVDAGARLNWLPQETILFNASALNRRLTVDLSAGSELFLVEPLVFGRAAMGETLTDIRFADRVEIRRDGEPAFLDVTAFDGDLHAHLARPFVAGGAGAMALAVYASASAEGQLATVRGLLPTRGGASLLDRDLMVIRLLADDSFELRQTLLPLLRCLNHQEIPRCWMM